MILLEESEETNMEEVPNVHTLRNLVKEKNYFKNAENFSCIDLILTNYSKSFWNTTGFQDRTLKF